jgi:hypothetical protein
MEQLHKEVEILASRNIGYVGYCQGCEMVQFLLGSVLSEISVSGFRSLVETFERLSTHAHERAIEYPNGRRIVLGTGCDHIRLSLNLEDFFEANSLFKDAVNALALDREIRALLGPK